MVQTRRVRLSASLFVVLVAVATLACGRLDFTYVSSVDAASAEDANDESIDALALGPWGSAQRLMELETTMDESDPELRGDGLEIVFHSTRTGTLGGYDLYHATRATTASMFGPVEPLTALNSGAEDMGPALSGDGMTILFGDGQDIAYATRPDVLSPFGSRQPLPALSSTDIDTAPTISGDGRTAIVTRGVTGGRELWLYTRSADGPVASGWSAGRQLTELSSGVTETSADLDETGLVVYFHSDRMTTKDDLYVATRTSITDPFGAPIRIEELVTSGDDGDPSVSADGRVLVLQRGLDLFQSTR